MSKSRSHDTLVAARQPAVRVSIPAKVVNDYDKFIEVQRSIFDRLGHLTCISGFDIRWDITTQYQVDDQLKIREIAGR